jgi:TolB protein
VIDAPRSLIYLSANDGHPGHKGLQSVPLPARREPDGSTLGFVEIPVDHWADGWLALIPSAGGATTYPAAGSRHVDGPEYSPDGAWIYFNTEEFGSRSGHAQLARVPSEGGALERLVSSDTVDWFPYPASVGDLAVHLSFPTGTLGHPADLEVALRVVRSTDWTEPLHTIELFGGQGTINVNSWSPDGQRFAYVAYPIADADEES